MSDDADRDEPKTERFNMFMSPSEMKAIDDWAWQNKIRSKSEAVRRLCQIGLLAGGEISGLTDVAEKLSELVADVENDTFILWSSIADPAYKGETLNREAMVDLLNGVLTRIENADEGLQHVSSALWALSIAVHGLAKNDEKTGNEIAKSAIERANENAKFSREAREELRESRRKLVEVSYKSLKRPSEGDK